MKFFIRMPMKLGFYIKKIAETQGHFILQKYKYMIQFLRKVSDSEQGQKRTAYTKDKASLNLILSNCTKARNFSRYLYGNSIFLGSFLPAICGGYLISNRDKHVCKCSRRERSRYWLPRRYWSGVESLRLLMQGFLNEPEVYLN